MAEKVYFDSRTDPHVGRFEMPSGEWVCEDDCPHPKHQAHDGEREWCERAIDALAAHDALIEPGECLTTGGHVYERIEDGGPSGWLRQCQRCGNRTDRPKAPPRPEHDRPYA